MRPTLTAIGAAGVLCVALPALAQAPPALPPLTFEAALAKAMTSSPAIVAARTQRAIGKAGDVLARQRLNPEFSYEASRDTPHQAFTAMLPLELGGKRGRRVDLAAASIAVIDADIEIVAADVRSEVRRAYYTLVAASERLDLAEDIRALAGRLRDAVDARFAAGDAPRLDAVQAALAVADSDNEVTAARGAVAAARAGLNVLIGQPPDTPVTTSDPLTPRALPALDTLLDLAHRTNVDLVALDRRIIEQDARLRLARTLRTPDVAAGGGLIYDAKPDFTYGWTLGVNVTLPLFTQHAGEIAVEDATLALVRAEREARRAEVDGQVAASYASAVAAREQLLRFQAEILPRSRDVEQMAQDSYTSGQTNLPALIVSLQAVRDVRRRGLQAGLEFYLAIADLERALGAPLQ